MRNFRFWKLAFSCEVLSDVVVVEMARQIELAVALPSGLVLVLRMGLNLFRIGEAEKLTILEVGSLQ